MDKKVTPTPKQIEDYCQKLITKLKNENDNWDIQMEFGKMLMRNIDSFTSKELERYNELKSILCAGEKIKVSSHKSVQQCADSGQLHKPVVMQAASASAQEASVGDGAAGQNVRVECPACGVKYGHSWNCSLNK